MEIKLTDEKQRYFPLRILRELYKNDKKKFRITTLELFLRGFTVESNKSSNIFPESYVKGKYKIIGKNAHTDKIDLNKIDFQLLHLGSLLNAFNVESSDFFINIPLEGFLSINQYINLELLESEFHKAGYHIENMNMYSYEKQIESLNEIKIKKDELFEPNILKVVREKNYLHIIELKHIFLEDSEEIVYFNQQGIKFIHELTRQEILNYHLEKPIEYLSLISIIKKELSNERIVFYLIEAFKAFYQISKYRDENLFVIFSANKFNLLNNHFSKYNIFLLAEFKPEIFIEYTKAQGVGMKRLLDILDVLNDYLLKNSEQKFSELYGLQQINTPSYDMKKLYVYKFLCTDSFWAENNYQAVFVDSASLSRIKVNIKKELGSKRKIFKKITEEIESNIHAINNLDIEKTKQNIKEYNKFSQLTAGRILEIVGINSSYLEKMNKSLAEELMNILSLSLIEIENLINNDDYENKILDVSTVFKNILWIMEHCLTSIENIEDRILHDLKDSELYVYKYRIIENRTLEEVGEKIGVTRERVRQVEKKIKKRIQSIITNSINPGIQLYLTVITNEICILEDLKFPAVINIFLANEYQLTGYFKVLDLIYLKTTENIKIVEDLDSKLSHLDPIIHRKKVINILISHESFPLYIIDLLMNNLNEILESYGYSLQGGLFIQMTVNIEQRIQYIIKSFDNQTIDLSDQEDIKRFRQEHELLFPSNNEYLDCNNILLVRKMRGSIERSSKYIMTEASTFKIYDYSLVPRELFKELYEYLIEYFEENIMVSYKKLYDVFEKKLLENKITPYMMYYILKYMFSRSFNFGKGNTMYIYKKGADKISTEEIVYSKVAANGGSLKKTIIINELGFELYTIDQVAYASNRLKTIDGTVYVTDLNLETIPRTLRLTIEKLSNKLLSERGFISIETMFYELKFNKGTAIEMMESKINEPCDLLIILKSLLPNIQGHTKFLYLKEQPLETSDVILYNFEVGKKFTRSDIIKEGKQLGYAESTIHLYMKQWQRTEKIILINEDYFVLPGSIQISNEAFEKVGNYLNKLLSNRKYLALYNIKGFRRELPSIRPYSWTPELISYVGKKVGFSFILIENIIHSVDPIIVLNAKNSALTYQNLLAEAMESYNANLHEEEVCKYLIDLGLMVQRKNKPKELPEEILAEQVIKVNEIGIVEKVGGN